MLDSYAVADLTPYEMGLSMSNVYNKRQEYFQSFLDTNAHIHNFYIAFLLYF